MRDAIDEQDDRDADLIATLRLVDRATAVPPIDPAREAALLAAFDAAGVVRKKPRRAVAHSSWLPPDSWLPPSGGRLWLRAAAVVVVAVGLAAILLRMPLGRRDMSPEAPIQMDADADIAGFMAWPGAAALPPLESGQLVRIDLPASILPSLGLFPPASDVTFVRADVLIGQDGLARAVRLVPAVSASGDEVSQ